MRNQEASTLLPLDILNREPVIDQMLNIVDLISKNRASYTFALNGAWGTGKTFVLDRIRAQLTDECNSEKYCVFHYNCWQYDYYEEPRIAIVAAMLDSVEDEVSLFPKETREIVQEVLSKVKNVLFQLGKSYLKSKLGEDPLGMLATVYKGNIIKNLIMDCQSYTKYRPNETTGGIFVSWRRKEELPTGA